MKTFAITTVAVLGLSLMAGTSAEAGGLYFSAGGYGNRNYSNNYRYGRGNWNRGRRGHYDYHDTSHYDYIPGHAVPHGNHLHYVPGQYQFHQQGHLDYHRGRHHHGW